MQVREMGIDRCKEHHVIGYRHLDTRFPTLMVAMVIHDREGVWIGIPLGKPPPVSPEALH
jgi:hypothetical protein